MDAPGPKAVDRVVVHEADGLHEGVADRRPDEAKAALLQILAESARLRRLGRELADGSPRADDRLTVHEAPEVRVEAAELGAQLQHPLRIVHRRLDLQPVADDPRVTEEALHVSLGEARNGFGVEVGERALVPLT